MENTAKVYQLMIGRQERGRYTDENREELRYRGNTDPARLDIPTIEAAHRIAELVGARSYIIADGQDMFARNPIFVTQDIFDFNAASARAKMEEEAERTGQAARMNATPATYEYKRYGDVRVVFIRSEVTYNPRHSARIQWSLYAHVVVDGEDIPQGYDYHTGIDPAEYRISTGSWLRAKFFKRNAYFIERHPEFAKVWDDMPDIAARMNELKRQIRES